MRTKLGKFQIEYLNKREYHIIKEEIFNNFIYDFKSSKRSPYIIDVGSHIGLSIIFFKSIFPDSKILGFEPNPMLFEILNKNVFSNNLMNVKVEKKAISSSENIIPFYVNTEDDMWHSNGSLKPKSWTNSEKLDLVSVQSTSLFNYLNVEIDMLKIDVEGSECIIIENISNRLTNVRNIALEYHPNSNMNKIINILTKAGFKLSYFVEGKEVKKPNSNKLMIIKGVNSLNMG